MPSISKTATFKESLRSLFSDSSRWLDVNGWTDLLQNEEPGSGRIARRRRESFDRPPDGLRETLSLVRAVRSVRDPLPLGMFAVAARILRGAQKAAPAGAFPLPRYENTKHGSAYNLIWQLWRVAFNAAPELQHQVAISSVPGESAVSLRSLLLDGGWLPETDLCIVDDASWDAPSLRWVVQTGRFVTLIPEQHRVILRGSVQSHKATPPPTSGCSQARIAQLHRLRPPEGDLLSTFPTPLVSLAGRFPEVVARAEVSLQSHKDYTPRVWHRWTTLLQIQTLLRLLSDETIRDKLKPSCLHRRIWGLRWRVPPRLWPNNRPPPSLRWPGLRTPIPQLWLDYDKLAEWMRCSRRQGAMARKLKRTTESVRVEVAVVLECLAGVTGASQKGRHHDLSDDCLRVCPAAAGLMASFRAKNPSLITRANYSRFVLAFERFADRISTVGAWQLVTGQ